MRSSTARARLGMLITQAALATLAGLLGVLGAGCGPAPYATAPEEPAAVEQQAPAVYVIVGQGPPAAARPAETAPPAPPADRWIPDGLPRPNPFAEARTWVGAYDCPQGRTGLALRVIDVRGKIVRAVFDFHHAPSSAAGQFIVAGAFDEPSGQMVFEPGPWIIHPDGYVSVGMRGRVSRDGTRFVGSITAPGCGGFQLRAAR